MPPRAVEANAPGGGSPYAALMTGGRGLTVELDEIRRTLLVEAGGCGLSPGACLKTRVAPPGPRNRPWPRAGGSAGRARWPWIAHFIGAIHWRLRHSVVSIGMPDDPDNTA